jgi:pyruvate dehydrogenase E1 component
MPKSDRKVWCFMGDGEMDEPESLGAISLAGREGLDNLIFVINCNLQRLDGPVRGNGKIIQELEGVFRGAGWNVIKVLWGSYWDPLLARTPAAAEAADDGGTVDGEYQNFKAFGGAYTREHFFGKYPETKALVANLSDDDIWRLNRGGHDPHKVYAAYHRGGEAHQGQPTVILAKTVKGYGMGSAGESLNPTHQTKKLDDDAVRASATASTSRSATSWKLAEVPFYHPGETRRKCSTCASAAPRSGGYLPQRRRKASESPSRCRR